VSLAVIPDLIALDVGLTANSCHKSEILNRLIKNKKTKKKPTKRKKLMKKKKKNLN
jgi:hypothetical protein